MGPDHSVEPQSALGAEIQRLEPSIAGFKAALRDTRPSSYNDYSHLPENAITTACQDVVQEKVTGDYGAMWAYKIGRDFHLSPSNIADAARRAIEDDVSKGRLKTRPENFIARLAEIDNSVLPLGPELSGRPIYDALRTSASEMIENGRNVTEGLALRGMLAEKRNRDGKYPNASTDLDSFDGANYLDCVLAGAASTENAWTKYSTFITREISTTVSRSTDDLNAMHTCTSDQLQRSIESNEVPQELVVQGVTEGVLEILRSDTTLDRYGGLHQAFRAKEIMRKMGLTDQEAISALASALAEKAINFYVLKADRYSPGVASSLLGENYAGQRFDFYETYTHRLSKIIPEYGSQRADFLYQTHKQILEKMTSPQSSSQNVHYALALEVYAGNMYLFDGVRGNTTLKDLLASHEDLSNLYYAAITLATKPESSKSLAKIALVENVAPNSEAAAQLLKLIAANDHDEARSLFSSFLTPAVVTS